MYGQTCPLYKRDGFVSSQALAFSLGAGRPRLQSQPLPHLGPRRHLLMSALVLPVRRATDA